MSVKLTLSLVAAAALTAQFPLAWLRARAHASGHHLTGRALYRVYRATPWWRAVSVATKRRAGWRCQACGTRTVRLQAHHKGREAYRLLAREWSPWRGLTTLLEALDDNCHRAAHRESDRWIRGRR